jgi:formylglycine-generating enzyme required for sulfatase activity
MEFVLVKGGCFRMGDTFGDGDPDEKPVHRVCVKDFYLGKYEVTQEQWARLTGVYPSRFQADDLPVENVSWNDVQEFLAKLRQKTGKAFRLPTEPEWEYAARSGGKREKWAGTSSESELPEYTWYQSNSEAKTHPVGQRKPNGLGLYDMSGNVWEWCSDWYGETYSSEGPQENPQGPTSGEKRVLRGGCWGGGPRGVRAAVRGRDVPSLRVIDLGLRLVLPPQ